MPSLKLSIPTTRQETPENAKAYISYTVKIEHPFPRAATTTSKRYSDFCALDSALRSEVASAPPAPLPPKSWLGGFLGLGSTASSPEAIEKRRAGLEAYLRAIETAEDGRWRVSKAYKAFLGLGDKEASNGKRASGLPGSQFGRDRVRDNSDWLDKHGELKSNLQDARRWLTKREQATAATAQHEAAANAKKSLVRASTLISALDEGLTRLSGGSADEWSGEKLGQGELRRRRDVVSGLRKERDGLESVLNSMAVKAAISGSGSSATPFTSSAAVTESQKAGLFKGAGTSSKPSSRRVLGAPAQETDRTRELDNEGVLQLQRQIIQEQDEDLVDLTTVVRRMKEMGVQINAELVEQDALLGLFEEDIERVDGKVKIAKKRIEKIR
ncbi:hypothetical protein ACJQWK_07894 [Exserohilum turcicum]|uniref:Phox-like protein n=1 Tax=Exserohilum turcicum (strain 28A) TaxID=671987 RepID=R0KLQ2_EXST2|nr:uncharacterized protein SETTUDRAFT_145524 [Exserohilum turcica Et28A]EOA90044.1 hypothetical protein SETTUDRAFT_145524 [Exserohilum turcica Et28A]